MRSLDLISSKRGASGKLKVGINVSWFILGRFSDACTDSRMNQVHDPMAFPRPAQKQILEVVPTMSGSRHPLQLVKLVRNPVGEAARRASSQDPSG